MVLALFSASRLIFVPRNVQVRLVHGDRLGFRFGSRLRLALFAQFWLLRLQLVPSSRGDGARAGGGQTGRFVAATSGGFRVNRSEGCEDFGCRPR